MVLLEVTMQSLPQNGQSFVFVILSLFILEFESRAWTQNFESLILGFHKISSKDHNHSELDCSSTLTSYRTVWKWPYLNSEIKGSTSWRTPLSMQSLPFKLTDEELWYCNTYIPNGLQLCLLNGRTGGYMMSNCPIEGHNPVLLYTTHMTPPAARFLWLLGSSKFHFSHVFW